MCDSETLNYYPNWATLALFRQCKKYPEFATSNIADTYGDRHSRNMDC